MPYKPFSTTKRYYTIGEVAQQLAISPSLIRFWEKELQLLIPKKDPQGIRRYTTVHIEKLQTVHRLIRKEGYTLQGARAAMKKEHKKAMQHKVLLADLKHLKAALQQLQE